MKKIISFLISIVIITMPQQAVALRPMAAKNIISRNSYSFRKINIEELKRLRKRILRNRFINRRVIVRLTGSPLVGKSTFAKMLADGNWGLKENEILLISLDKQKSGLLNIPEDKRLIIIEGNNKTSIKDNLTDANTEIIYVTISADFRTRLVNMLRKDIFRPRTLWHDATKRLYAETSAASDFEIDLSFGSIADRQIRNILATDPLDFHTSDNLAQKLEERQLITDEDLISALENIFWATIKKANEIGSNFSGACTVCPEAITKEVMLKLIRLMVITDRRFDEKFQILSKMLDAAMDNIPAALLDDIAGELVKFIEGKSNLGQKLITYHYTWERRDALYIYLLLAKKDKSVISEKRLIRLIRLITLPYHSTWELGRKQRIVGFFEELIFVNQDAITISLFEKTLKLARRTTEDLDITKMTRVLTLIGCVLSYEIVEKYLNQVQLPADLINMMRQVDRILDKNKGKMTKLSPGAQQLVKIKLLLQAIKRGKAENAFTSILEEVTSLDSPYMNFDDSHKVANEVHTERDIREADSIFIFGLFGYLSLVPANTGKDRVPLVKIAFESPLFSTEDRLEIQTLPSAYKVQHQIMLDIRLLGKYLGITVIPSVVRIKKGVPKMEKPFVGIDRHISISGEINSEQEGKYLLLVSMALNIKFVEVLKLEYGIVDDAEFENALYPGGGYYEIRKPKDSVYGGKRTEVLDMLYYVTENEGFMDTFSRVNYEDMRYKYLLSLAAKARGESLEQIKNLKLSKYFEAFCMEIEALFRRKRWKPLLTKQRNYGNLIHNLRKNPEMAESIVNIANKYAAVIEDIILNPQALEQETQETGPGETVLPKGATTAALAGCA